MIYSQVNKARTFSPAAAAPSTTIKERTHSSSYKMSGDIPGHHQLQQALGVPGAPSSEDIFTPMGAGTSFFSDLGNATEAVRPSHPPPTTNFIQRPALPRPPSKFLGDGSFHQAPAMQQPTPFQGPVGPLRPQNPPKYPDTPLSSR